MKMFRAFLGVIVVLIPLKLRWCGMSPKYFANNVQ